MQTHTWQRLLFLYITYTEVAGCDQKKMKYCTKHLYQIYANFFERIEVVFRRSFYFDFS